MKTLSKIIRLIGLHINGLMPFLYPMLYILKQGVLFRGVVAYYRDLLRYKSQEGNTFPLKLINLYPVYYDRYENAGLIPTHYFFQDIWAAKKVFRSKTDRHYDIGSRLDGFISHCLVFCDITMLDIRPLKKKVPGLSFMQCDCTNMTKIRTGSLKSLSSLHAVEHFGLGRYGDSINRNGYLEVIREIQRVVKKQGDIYFSVPIGNQRLEFNAHRIFDPNQVINLFNKCDLVDFSVVDDNNNFYENVDHNKYRTSTYSCGLFHFKKK